MNVGLQLAGAGAAAVFMLLMGASVQAAENAEGITAVAAEELDRRSKEAEQAQGNQKGMSDSSVRVLMTYAISIIPAVKQGGDPNKYFIPTGDARRVIRAATRSAYADACGLTDLVRANYDTMVKMEKARNTWSPEQIEMIEALHVFAVSYFTGNIKITATEVDEEGKPAGEAPADETETSISKGGVKTEDEGASRVVTAKKLDCPPEQREKVTNAINAYVQAAQAAAPQ